MGFRHHLAPVTLLPEGAHSLFSQATNPSQGWGDHPHSFPHSLLQQPCSCGPRRAQPSFHIEATMHLGGLKTRHHLTRDHLQPIPLLWVDS